MKKNRIIGFCGRMRSGKTELATICEKYGYQKIYFAFPLKRLCAELLNLSIEILNEKKANNEEINFIIDEGICNKLAKETQIPLETIQLLSKGKFLKTVREMLQFVGTDIIRKYNPDWHVNRIREMMVESQKYVIDDVRFPNEKNMIEEMGGDCWFIIRPTIDNVSNHISETSLTWQQCWNKIIINDSSLFNLKFKWDIFMDNYDKSLSARSEEFNRILENGSTNELTSLSLNDVLFINKSIFEYVPKEIAKENIKEIKKNDDNSITIVYNNNMLEMIDNPLLIEDIKMLL